MEAPTRRGDSSGHGSRAAKKSVAVLYFENQSGGKEDEYFRDGMTEDIITELSKITQLQIFPRSEMLAFRDKPTTAPQVGQQLGASFVLEGTIRRSGNRLRITAQLVESRRGIPCGRSATTARWKTFSRFRTKSRGASRRRCESRYSAGRKNHRREADGKYPSLRFLLCADGAIRGARTWITRCRCSSRRSSWIKNFALAHAGIAYLCGLIYELREQNRTWITRRIGGLSTAPWRWLRICRK